MNVTEEWWEENAISGGMGKKEIKGQYLTHVESIRVDGPPDRDDLECEIYGEISFNVGDSGEPVVLYSRLRDNPDLVYLEHPREGRNLTLSDGHKSDRALGAVSPSNPLYVKMKLYEYKGGSEEDELIADVVDCDCDCGLDLGRAFVVQGEAGFRFEVCYAVIFGARVEVEVMVTDGEKGNSMWARLTAYQALDAKLSKKAACQSLEAKLSQETAYQCSIPSDGLPVGETCTTLVTIHEKYPVNLDVGKRIELERRFVVAPMKYDRYLSIAIAAVIEDVYVIEDHEVYFPLRLLGGEQPFWTNEEMTHVKLMRLTNGTELSVSIKFVDDPVLVHQEDPC